VDSEEVHQANRLFI
jgi:chromosome segregation ATPase